jgi:hypothetical protein
LRQIGQSSFKRSPKGSLSRIEYVRARDWGVTGGGARRQVRDRPPVKEESSPFGEKHI